MLKTIKEVAELLGLPISTIRQFQHMNASKHLFHQFGGKTSIVWVDYEPLLKMLKSGKLDS